MSPKVGWVTASRVDFPRPAYLPTSPEGRHTVELAAWPTCLPGIEGVSFYHVYVSPDLRY